MRKADTIRTKPMMVGHSMSALDTPTLLKMLPKSSNSVKKNWNLPEK